jgi:hypothetical protein
MTDYTKSTNFTTKDTLPPGSALKIVRGTEIDTEFNNIATAVATKANSTSPTLSGGTIDNAVIGGTTAAAGTFTTLTSTGNTVLGDAATDTLNVGAGGLIKDASGNVGVGVTPSAWAGGYKAIQVAGSSSAAFSGDTGSAHITTNTYFDGTNWKYIASATAMDYYQFAGSHVWRNAASGTAGNAITFTQGMSLDANNNFLVNGTFGSGVQVFYNNTDVINSRSGQVAGTSRSLYTGWYSATSTTQGTLSFNVTTNGNVTNTNNSYGPISDIKLKENITDATPKLDDLMKVRIVNYNLKADLGYENHKQIGVIAQELEQVFAGLVDETPDKDEAGNALGTTTKSVKMTVFIPMLIKAIQEQQAIITQQAAALTTLTERITALEAK